MVIIIVGIVLTWFWVTFLTFVVFGGGFITWCLVYLAAFVILAALGALDQVGKGR